MKKLALALLLIVMYPGMAMAAGTTSTATGAASAKIIFPLTLVHAAGYRLNFGKFSGGTGGTVVVSPTSGAGTVTGGVAFVAGSVTADDEFYVTGQTYQVMNITTTGGTVTSGGNSMSFATTPMLAAGEIATTGTSATAYFTVGGTLNVNASQPAGVYNGTYSVTVAYQ